MEHKIIRLTREDGQRMRALNALFYTAFEDDPDYNRAPPSEAYLSRVLEDTQVIALVAEAGREIIGGLVAYTLQKLEQERAEIYIYDLAVAEEDRRRGIATDLINEVRRIATDVNAWVVYIQAEQDDPPAAALYTKLGSREEVLHFDLTPLPRN